MFLNVIIHSMSSPAYTLDSFHRTNAAIFEAGDAGAMVCDVEVETRDRC